LALTLALTELSELSMLAEEFESERLEVWFVLMLALTSPITLSTLDEEFESDRLDV
jgi:hypothetical protein